jgi:hypothetical protein
MDIGLNYSKLHFGEDKGDGMHAEPILLYDTAIPPLGFSRQEHWSGLPFPSPMHESEKGK